MTGIVPGRMETWGDGNYIVRPEPCPVEDPHRTEEGPCYRHHTDGWTRQCPYLLTITAPANSADRKHPTGVALDAKSRGASLMRCQIICHAQRRNRPPGC